ncbi:amidohydrolase [Candidatus Zixiibacteriota bacterium]
MKRSMTLLTTLVLIMTTAGIEAQERAEMAVINGKIWTVDESNPWAEAVAVTGGRIVAAGPYSEVRRYIGRRTEVLDVEGAFVMPGFFDSHCHFSGGGQRLSQLDFSRVFTIEAIQEILAEAVAETPPGESIFALGSFPNEQIFGGLGWPTKEMLDAVSPDNPVVVNRGGGHAVWLNSQSLAISGITGETEAPEGGEIVLDPETGELTGILKEAASSLVRVPGNWTPRAYIEVALDYAKQVGITTISTGASSQDIDIFRELQQGGDLTIRVTAWLGLGGLDRYIEEGIEQDRESDWVRIGLLKGFIDGTIGVRSALMFEDFTEEPGNSGLAQYEEEEFYRVVAKAHEHGYQVGVHAIGDRAVHWTLNAYERAQQQYGQKGLRHRVEHATVIAIDDVPRFAELGVIASMQPSITGGQAYREQRLGVERSHRVDMWRSLLETGAWLSWGTDWPVSDIDPRINLMGLVTRYPEQRLTMEEAIRHYTLGSAYANFWEDDLGSLEVGKLADMVVLSKNLLEIYPYQILQTEVLQTIVGGKVVYSRDDRD